MRLSPDKIAEILRDIHKSTGLKGSGFIRKYKTSIGVPDVTSLSRLESGARPASDRVIQGYVSTFPELSGLIHAHLLWKTPRVLDDHRKFLIERQPDDSFVVREEAQSTVRVEYYLFAHVRGLKVARDVQSRVPGLFGFRVWPSDAKLKKGVLAGYFSDLAYFVEAEDGKSVSVEVDPLPLSLEDVAELGGDVNGLSAVDVQFFGCQLGYEGSPKRFVIESSEHRRPTLRQWYWISLLPCRSLLHQVEFRTQPGSDASSFQIQPFLPSPTIRRRETPHSVSITINGDDEAQPGHGWVATWVNPPL